MSFGAMVLLVLFVSVFGSLLYAPLVMLACRIIVGSVPSYFEAWKACVLALFTSSVVALGTMALFGAPLDPTDEGSVSTVRGLAKVLGYLVQTFIFGLFLEDEDAESIGMFRGFLIVILLPVLTFVLFLPLGLLFLFLMR